MPEISVRDKVKEIIDGPLNKNDHDFIVEKGSIAIDGVSLTIGKIFQNKIRIFLTTHTTKNTIIEVLKYLFHGIIYVLQHVLHSFLRSLAQLSFEFFI